MKFLVTVAISVCVLFELSVASPQQDDAKSKTSKQTANPAVPLLLNGVQSARNAPWPFSSVTVKSKRPSKMGDDFTLEILGENKATSTMEFESSYAKFSVLLVPALPGGEAVLCLQTGCGRGTGVREETLRVFRLQESKLLEVLSIPISGWDRTRKSKTANYPHWERQWIVADRDGDGVAEITTIPVDNWSRVNKRNTIYSWSKTKKKFIQKK